MQTTVDEPGIRMSLLSTGGVEVQLDAPALIPEITERGRRFLRGLNELLEDVSLHVETLTDAPRAGVARHAPRTTPPVPLHPA